MVAVILSGGAGARLWPVSRQLCPKPFMRLPDGQSLLQKALLRAVSVPGVREVLTVTGREHYFSTKNEYAATGLPEGLELTYVVEPLRRNTAPAIALAALQVAQRHGPEAVMLVLPSDQLIENLQAFGQAAQQAESAAERGYLVTFGIRPTYPATGFGYIQQGEPLGGGAFKVERFVEKPDLETAEGYLEHGGFYWNAGIFCFQAGAYLRALESLSPEVHEAVLRCWERSPKSSPSFIDAVSFKAVPNISVDYAVMEKSDQVAVVPAAFAWSDLGSWDAAAELLPPDAEGNRVFGDVVLVGAQDTFVQSEGRVVAAVGVEKLVIVDTPDALLVARRDRVQDVRKAVEQLQAKQHQAATRHRTVQRPWGSYTLLEEGPNFAIRRLVIRPGQGQLLQLHHHRSEHWVVVSGIARVVRGEQELWLRTNESINIPAATPHRLSNPGLIDLVIIEVQSGEYLGEDDVVRLEASEELLLESSLGD